MSPATRAEFQHWRQRYYDPQSWKYYLALCRKSLPTAVLSHLFSSSPVVGQTPSSPHAGSFQCPSPGVHVISGTYVIQHSRPKQEPANPHREENLLHPVTEDSRAVLSSDMHMLPAAGKWEPRTKRRLPLFQVTSCLMPLPPGLRSHGEEQKTQGWSLNPTSPLASSLVLDQSHHPCGLLPLA